jgi:CheY-like chemotaxis protein
MVYGFVKQSSGHIKIESEPGRGTTVKIYLPRAASAAEAAAAPRTGVPVAMGNEKILVVEDNENVRNAVVEQLAGLGYRTVVAETGAAALALLDQHPDLDLVFSDVVMRGGMNGHELVREIRKRRPGLKILLTSGHDMKTAPDSGDERFDILRKPYRKYDLAAKLREILAAG